MPLYAFEVRWAEIVGRTLAPRGALGGVVDDLALGVLFDGECRASPWYAALVFRASLWLTWFAPLVLYGRLRTFAGLDETAREDVLERLLASRRYVVRSTALFLKLTICTLVLGDPRALARLGAYRETVGAARQAS
jgi:hypothetical protein